MAGIDALSEERFVAEVEEALGHEARGRAKLIALTGVDGAGKSTQVARLAAHLRVRGLTVETVWCRSGTAPWRSRPWRCSASWRGSRRRSASEADARRTVRAGILGRRPAWLAWRALIVVDYGPRLSLRVRHARRASDVLLLDRYWHDVMVDYSFGRALSDPPPLLAALLPRPDGIVILDVDGGRRAGTQIRHP